jgi:hypothetical protein
VFSITVRSRPFSLDTDSFAVLAERQELDPGSFKGPADRVERTRPRINPPLFEPDHGIQGDDGPVRQLLAGPSEKRASCPNLAGRDHPER